MKKKLIVRGAISFPLGIAIGCCISIFFSLAEGDGYYSPCVPEFISMAGSEINAVILQTVLCGLLGTGCGAGSVIWEIQRWSLAKQTGLYFLLVSALMMPIAYITRWMEHSLKGFLSYLGIFVLIFAAIWIVEYMIIRHSLRKINARL